MNTPPAASARDQSRGEELANSISHGAGLIASVVATPFLIIGAVEHGNIGFIVGASVFASTAVLWLQMKWLRILCSHFRQCICEFLQRYRFAK